jgi:hypothetical protein
MKEKIKKYFGEIMTIIGSGLFSYNIFNFSYRIYSKSDIPRLPGIGEFEGIAYYYSSNTLTLISTGIILIVLGIFIIKMKKN